MKPRIRIVAMGDSTTAGTPAFQSPRRGAAARRRRRNQPVRLLADAGAPRAGTYSTAVSTANAAIRSRRASSATSSRRRRPSSSSSPASTTSTRGARSPTSPRRLRAMYDAADAAASASSPAASFHYNTARPDQNAKMRAVNDWIREQAAADPRIAFVDTRAAVAAPGSPDRLASSPDDLHPSVDGYRRMAEAIAPVVVQVLGR